MIPSPERLLEDLRQRLENLAPLAAFLSLTGGNRRFETLDLQVLGFAILRLLYERMLEGRPASFADVEELIRSLASRCGGATLHPEDLQDVARDLFFNRLQNKGAPFSQTWKDPQTGDPIVIPVRLIDLEREFQVGQAAHYRLSNQGLGFLFQTREFRLEAMVSIEQLFLRQQLEKGNFDGARQRLGAMSVLICQLHREMQDMIARASQNALQIPFETYADLHRRVYDQFDQEAREFQEQRQLVLHRRALLESQPEHSRDQRDQAALRCLVEIEGRLDRLMGEHRRLFGRKQELQAAYRHALESQFARGFRSHLNPETDLFDVLLQGRHPLEVLEGSFAFLQRPALRKRFTPWRCLVEWAAGRSDQETDPQPLDPPPEPGIGDEVRERALLRQARCMTFFRHLLVALRERPVLCLSELLATLPAVDQGDLLASFDLCLVVVLLHQAGTIDLARLLREPGRILTEAEELSLEATFLAILRQMPDLPSSLVLQVQAAPEMCLLANGARITDFRFSLDSPSAASNAHSNRG